MYQIDYLRHAKELWNIHIQNDLPLSKWLTHRELEQYKGGPGLISKIRTGGGKMSELKPVYYEYVEVHKSPDSCNTSEQWACKFDKWLFNEYEFTPREVDELHADRRGQIRRKTSSEVTN